MENILAGIRSKTLQIACGVFNSVTYLLVVVLALAVMACFVPSIPVLGSLGPLLLAPYGAWISILSFATAVFFFIYWRNSRKRRLAVMIMLASFALIGSIIIQSKQIAVASDHGVAVDLARTLWLGGERYKTVSTELEVYTTDDGLELPLAIYRSLRSDAQGLSPIIVYVHGGGWGAGSLHDRANDMRWFADRGYLVISVEYSLSSEKNSTWNVAESEIGCALVWVADNAWQYGADASRLAMFGESAGGNLVLNVSYKSRGGLLSPACAGRLPGIQATIAGYPIVDADLMYRNKDVLAGRFARLMTTHYTGGTPDQYPKRYEAISSDTHIHPQAPPTLLLPGLADHLLPPEPVYAFAEKARASGVDVRVVGFPFGEHSFDQRNGSIGSQLVRGTMLKFLEDVGLASRPTR